MYGKMKYTCTTTVRGSLDDLAVVTFDDVEIVAGEPFFTCAAQPAEEMGRAAVECLVDRLRGDGSPPRQPLLPPPSPADE